VIGYIISLTFFLLFSLRSLLSFPALKYYLALFREESNLDNLFKLVKVSAKKLLPEYNVVPYLA